jgi:Bacterial Ig-like domain (group 2)
MIGLKAIKPNQSIEIDVKKLRDDQTPDRQGRVIPLNTTNGQLQWVLRRKDNLPEDDLRGTFALIGRSEQIDFVKNTSSNYACQNCCGGETSTGFLYPNSDIEISQGDTQQFEAFEEGITCYGFLYIYQINSASWSSSNTSAATINQSGLATGVGSGTTNVKATWRSTRTREGNPCPTGGELFAVCDEGIEQVFEKVLAKTDKEEDETVPNRLPCGVCTNFYVNISGNASAIVKPKVTLTVPATAQDGDTITFSVTTEGGTPTNYQWSFESPSGAGNNPQVNFTAPNAATTDAKANWFALPNQACPISSAESSYTIKCKVTFQGGTEVTKDKSFKVKLPSQGGKTKGIVTYGGDVFSAAFQLPNNSTEWRVTGHNLTKSVAVTKTVNIPTTSQFYSKVNTHEEVHVGQWGAGGLFGSLYDVNAFYTIISGFTDATQSGLNAKILAEFQRWRASEDTRGDQLCNRSEIDAYAVSDSLTPQFFYMRCGRTTFNCQ